MASTDTQTETGETAMEGTITVSPEVKVAAAQAVLSEGPIEVSEVLRDRQEETLVLVQRLLASAGITATFSTPEDAESNKVGVELHQTAGPNAKELTPEQVAEQWLGQFKTRFDALPQLHKGVQWVDVEKSLLANPEAISKLMKLDTAGFEMNVFRAKNNGEIQFRTAQTDVTKIAAEYRTIMYDQQAQADFPQYKANGNAVDLAASLGVELADSKLYKQFLVENGWVWLQTDAATRESGNAFDGYSAGIVQADARSHYDDGSFCAALRVKKA